MKTELINETGFENKELIAQMIRAAEYAAQTVTGTDGLEVGLTLTDPDSIRELNREYRGVDTVTDVLSFPLMEFEKGAEGRVDPEDEDAVDPDTGLIMLGDIVINMERVFSQAEEYGHSPEREGCYLCVHSVLHLLGYDHETSPEDEADLFRRQREIMHELGLPRGEKNTQNLKNQ